MYYLLPIMHEWALAEAVLEAVKENLEGNKLEDVRKINLLFGELQDVDPDIFQSGLKQMLIDYPFGEEVFSVEIEKAGFRCNACGEEWGLDRYAHLSDDQREAIHFLPEAAHVHIQCPKCESPDFTIQKGRGVTIKSIDLEIGG